MLTSDGLGRAALAGGDHDEQFHDIVVDSEQSVSPLARNSGILLAAAALHDEDILVTDRSLCKAVLAGQRRPVGAREATN